MARLRLVEPRRKDPESEKITINLGYIDLGQIDLLVQEGFYSNRTDFIRTAIRAQLSAHADVLKQTVARRSLVLGLQRYTRQDLETGAGSRRATAHPGTRPGDDRRRRAARSSPRKPSPPSWCWAPFAPLQK